MLRYTAAEKALNRAEKVARDRKMLPNVSQSSIEAWEIHIFQALARSDLKPMLEISATVYQVFQKLDLPCLA